MKRILILSIFLVWGISKLFSQEPIQIDTNTIKNPPKYLYCEIVGQSKMLSNKVTIEIDFGQKTKFFENRKLKDPVTGNPVVFNSMIDALNFMGKDGWEFVQAYLIGESNVYVYHFLLKKPFIDFDAATQKEMLK
ncbi:MAG: hypothetical protein NT175_05650 [Bacteroidetes bacterium]|nr:hypothetical protein [Bacteroidota bacterium]